MNHNEINQTKQFFGAIWQKGAGYQDIINTKWLVALVRKKLLEQGQEMKVVKGWVKGLIGGKELCRVEWASLMQKWLLNGASTPEGHSKPFPHFDENVLMNMNMQMCKTKYISHLDCIM